MSQILGAVQNILYDLVQNKEIKRFKINGYRSRDIKFSKYESLLICDTRRPNKDAITIIYDMQNENVIHEYEWAPQDDLAISINQEKFAVATRIIILYQARWDGTGIIEDNSEDNIIYPNPAGNQAFLRINSDSHELAQIILYGSVGTNNIAFEYQLNIGLNDIPLDISDLSTGTYLINISTQSFSKTYKLIKE